MPLDIQRAPAGLLELLGLRGTGNTPRQLDELLQGHLDLTPLYLAPLARTIRAATAAVGANGFFGATAATIPQGELWVLSSIAASSTNMAAGESYRLALAISRGGSVNTLEIFAQSTQTASGVTQRIGTGYTFPEFKILGPGDVPGVYVTDVTAGAHVFSIDVSYARLAF